MLDVFAQIARGRAEKEAKKCGSVADKSFAIELDLRTSVVNPLVIRLPDDIKLTIVNDHEIRVERETGGGAIILIDTECLDVRDSRKDPLVRTHCKATK